MVPRLGHTTKRVLQRLDKLATDPKFSELEPELSSLRERSVPPAYLRRPRHLAVQQMAERQSRRRVSQHIALRSGRARYLEDSQPASHPRQMPNIGL